MNQRGATCCHSQLNSVTRCPNTPSIELNVVVLERSRCAPPELANVSVSRLLRLTLLPTGCRTRASISCLSIHPPSSCVGPVFAAVPAGATAVGQRASLLAMAGLGAAFALPDQPRRYDPAGAGPAGPPSPAMRARLDRGGVISVSAVYADINVHRPPAYWDYDMTSVPWGSVYVASPHVLVFFAAGSGVPSTCSLEFSLSHIMPWHSGF